MCYINYEIMKTRFQDFILGLEKSQTPEHSKLLWEIGFEAPQWPESTFFLNRRDLGWLKSHALSMGICN